MVAEWATDKLDHRLIKPFESRPISLVQFSLSYWFSNLIFFNVDWVKIRLKLSISVQCIYCMYVMRVSN